jgi:hypothetical protein
MKGTDTFWARFPHTNMCPETFNLWVIAERLHVCAPAYFSRAVRDVLSDTYHDRWIGRGGTTAWPPHSPELNPLHFCLWGHLKPFVYAALVDNDEAHHRCIVDACQTIRNYLDIRVFELTRLCMMRRVEACIESRGGHFEHLLQMYSFSYNSQIKYFLTHVDADIYSYFGMWNSCQKFVRTFQLHFVYLFSIHSCSRTESL